MGRYDFSHFVFNRDANNYKLEIKQYLQQMALEKLYGHIQKNEIMPVTTFLYKNKLQWIKDFYVKPKH